MVGLEAQSWLREQLSPMQAPDAVIHLGAGTGALLGLWQDCSAQRIILVEPNPEYLPELRGHCVGLDHVQILPTAVSDKSGRLELHLFSDASFSSLRAPTGLSEIMPGLVRLGQVRIACQTAEQMLNDLQLDAEGNNWLVIDTPGEEAAVLQSLLESDLRYAFSVVVLAAGAEPLYEGAVAAEVLLMKLKNIGYTVHSADLSDADIPRYCLTLDSKAIKSAGLQARVAELGGALLVEHDRASKQAEEIKPYEAMVAELEAAHARAIAQLETEKNVAFEKVKESEKQLAELKEKLELQRSDLGIALRLQALRENDLRDLQGRYAKLKEDSNEQRALLGKLHQRLSVAAEYLQLLEESKVERADVPEGFLKDLTGDEETLN